MTTRRAITLKILVCLALGAIVNVLLAWWCCPPLIPSGVAPSSPPPPPAALFGRDLGKEIAEFSDYMASSRIRIESPTEWPVIPPVKFWPSRPTNSLSERTFGYQARYFAAGHCYMKVQCAGWPAPALMSVTYQTPELLGETGLWDMPGWMRFADRGNLPTSPAWPGFAIDTAYWSIPFLSSVMVWRGLRTLRASRRISRGHCPHCNYDLSTLPTTTSCPECGKQRA